MPRLAPDTPDNSRRLVDTGLVLTVHDRAARLLLCCDPVSPEPPCAFLLEDHPASDRLDTPCHSPLHGATETHHEVISLADGVRYGWLKIGGRAGSFTVPTSDVLSMVMMALEGIAEDHLECKTRPGRLATA